MITINTPSSVSQKGNKTVRKPTFSFVRKHPFISIIAFLALCIVFGLAIVFVTPIFSPSTDSLAEVNITNGHFASTALDITVGDTVQFKNTTHASYTLCIGLNADCNAKGDGPKALYAHGITLAANQTVHVTFDTADTYPITAQHVATMNLTITVNQNNGDENGNNSDNGSDMNNLPSNTGSSSSNDSSSQSQNTGSNTNSVTSPDENSNDDNENSTGSSSSDSSSSSDNSSSSSSSGDDGGDE